jgi:hypothetical protein
VAFADDDSWWEPGALRHAAGLFADEPRLGLLHARLLVGPDGREDPLCRLLAAGPREPGAAGPTVTGHLACAVVVRREAYLEAGGYHRLMGVGGEERLLALDLAAAGWHQWYVDEVVAWHRPSPIRESGAERDARVRRNDLLTTWLRLPWPEALAETRRFVADAREQPHLRRETTVLARALPSVIAERRVVPPRVLQLLAATAERQPGPPAR